MADMNKLRTLVPFSELDLEAQDQIHHALDLPFLKALAIMPDCHAGYSLPIGGIALLDDVLWPAAVGFDIGCGMCCCLLTDIRADSIAPKKTREKILKQILRQIPMGKGTQHERSVPYLEFQSATGNKELDRAVNAAVGAQMGTLGSGNHFIEIGRSLETGCVGVTIHSGSRAPGWKIADWHMREANEADKELPRGFLSLTSESGRQYLADMAYAEQYASDNRKHMMDAVLRIILDEYKATGKDMRFDMRVKGYMAAMVDENHNHAVVTPEGVLHRKGATPADEGRKGVIPANMKHGVWVTEGLGNEQFLSSAAHGAGRRLSRLAAKRKFDLSSHRMQMKGITCNVDKGTLDEDPRAYKDINRVMELQEGIVVTTVGRLVPMIVAKGSEVGRKTATYRCAVCGNTLTDRRGEPLAAVVVDKGLMRELGYPEERETSKGPVTYAFCEKCYENAH